VNILGHPQNADRPAFFPGMTDTIIYANFKLELVNMSKTTTQSVQQQQQTTRQSQFNITRTI
jgi:hypothetical protein